MIIVENDSKQFWSNWNLNRHGYVRRLEMTLQLNIWSCTQGVARSKWTTEPRINEDSLKSNDTLHHNVQLNITHISGGLKVIAEGYESETVISIIKNLIAWLVDNSNQSITAIDHTNKVSSKRFFFI